MKPSESPAEKNVPPQHTGVQTNTVFAIALPSIEESIQRYNRAKERLLEVNRWHELSRPFSANFTLTDEEGQVLHHKAQAGDHIRIELPAPGSKTGNGYDWVEIEKIEDRCTSSGNSAYIAIRVRPAGNPQKLHGKTAHFFDPAATSSFVIERTGRCIRASVYGRNEKPNISPASFWDKLRNTLVALGASLGLAKPQWKGLMKGLLK